MDLSLLSAWLCDWCELLDGVYLFLFWLNEIGNECMIDLILECMVDETNKWMNKLSKVCLNFAYLFFKKSSCVCAFVLLQRAYFDILQ